MRRHTLISVHVVYWIISIALLVVAIGRDLSQSSVPPSDKKEITQSTHGTDADNLKNEGRKSFWGRTTDDPVAFFTFWLAIFTFVLAVSTIGLWTVTWRSGIRQSREMRESIRVSSESSANAERAARAARDSADALPALERAYIFVEIDPNAVKAIDSIIRAFQDRHEGMPTSAPSELVVGYQLINHGKTPAIIKAMSAYFMHRADFPQQINYTDVSLPGEIVVQAGEIYPPPIEKAVTSIDARLSDTTGVAPPTHLHYQKRQPLSQLIDAEAARSVQHGHSFLWFYGHALYEDVFGRPHETRFCWFYNRIANRYQQYNRGDEDLNRRT